MKICIENKPRGEKKGEVTTDMAIPLVEECVLQAS